MENLEDQRQANIRRNQNHLKELGILYKAPPITVRSSKKPKVTKKQRLDQLAPCRSSARIASTPVKPSYNEDERADEAPRAKRKKGNSVAPSTKIEVNEPMHNAVPIKDIENLRAGWTAWKPNGPQLTRDEDSVFHFKDQPTFLPNKSPEEMLREGCFGGSYFRPLYSSRLGITVRDDYKELPSSWYEGLDIATFLTSPSYNADSNKYKVKCGQSIEEWEAAGWIAHEYDVRGWFQWYCRFFMGRRCEDDERQIGRWQRCVGVSGRWRRSLLKKYMSMGVREVFDDGEDEEKGDVSPVQHQTCFQWAYEWVAVSHS